MRAEVEPASDQLEPGMTTAVYGTMRDGRNPMMMTRSGNVGEGRLAAETRGYGRLAGVLALVMGGTLGHRAGAGDPPPLPVVTIEATDAVASEIGLDPGRFTFMRGGDAAGELTVTFTVGGTATNGEDYESIPASISFAAGELTATLVITPLCDGDPDEEAETVTLTLAAGTSYDLGQGPSSATVSIDDDTRPLVTIQATDPDASEIGLDPGRFTFTRVGNLTGSLTVTFTFDGSTATNGQDYDTIAASVVFANGESTATVVIRPLRDTESTEGEETVTLTLQPDDSYRLCGGSAATILIQDDTTLPLCDPPSSTTCKNQWMIDLYTNTCEFFVDACNWGVDTASDLCAKACNFITGGIEYYCNARELLCDAGQNACTIYSNEAFNVCMATGLGSGCNLRDAACRLGCAGTCTSQCVRPCLIPWRDACKDCVRNCSSSCNGACTNAYNNCKAQECAGLQATCKGCNECNATMEGECQLCEDIADAECKANCEDTAPPCITEKQLGETCNWRLIPECATGLRCLPDLTGLEGLGPGALIEAILKSTSFMDALENIREAAGAGNINLAEFVCVNNNCTCQQPLLEGVGEELDAKACMVFYRPERHLQAWLVNDALGGMQTLREALADLWEDAGMPQSLIDNLNSRYQKLAFTYGLGGGAVAGVGASVEVGTVYGPDCYGCYYTLCAGAASEASVSVSAALGVSDATGDEDPVIKNLEGWSRVIEIGAETPLVNVGVSTGMEFAAPEALTFEPNKVFNRDEWSDQLEALKSQFDVWKERAEDLAGTGADRAAVLEQLMGVLLDAFIPTGRSAGVSVGVGVGPPVTGAAGLCYTWVTPSICLSERDGSGGVGCIAGGYEIDLQEVVPIDPGSNGAPVARCEDRTVAARGVGLCNADVSVDWGSWDPEGQLSALTQDPPEPYGLVGNDGTGDDGVGVHDVTLTASDGTSSATCAATVTVQDRTPPELTCPPGATHECQGNYQAVVDPGDATATDCSSFTMSDPGSASYPLGTTVVTYTATDVRQNGASCTTAVTVADRLEPSITCPEGIAITSAPGQCAYMETFTVSTSDVCDPSPVVACVDQYGGSVAPGGHSYPVGITRVTCTSTDSSGNSQSDAFAVEVNDPPQVTAVNAASQTVQYSDRIVPVTITATDCGPGPLTISHNGVPDGLALPAAADACYSTGGPVECLFTLQGTVLAPEGDYDVEVTIWDEKMLASVATSIITIHVKAEDAAVTFDIGNSVAVQVATAGGSSGPFGLSVDVRELVTDLASTGAALPGDIRKAVLSMTLVPVGPGSPVAGTCAPDNAGGLSGFDYSEVLTFTCAFVAVPVNMYTVEAVLAANGAGEFYYTGSNEDMLVVFDPSLGFTTGGGHFYWPGTTDRTNFSYTMKYNRKQANIQGSLLIIRHLPNGSIYRVKSNALYGLALGAQSGHGWASFAGKGTFQDPTMIEPEGNHEFVTYVEDRGERGAGIDRFWLRVFDRDDLPIQELSLPETAVGNAVVIGGGNIAVPHRR